MTISSRKKSLGQCFLEDKNMLSLEAKLADCAGKNVLEIGAGDGRLTQALLSQKPKKIVAIEKDAHFAEILRKRFSYSKIVEIVEEDFLELKPAHFDVIVGNIPYYISSDIVFRLNGYVFDHALLMVQKEFAKKMSAKPNDSNYGRLSVTAQLAFEVKYERTVLRHLFRPMPEVDSAIILLKPSGIKITQFEENVIRYLFQHKNKTVRNALMHSKMFEDVEIVKVGSLLERRVRTLNKEECLAIAKALEKA